jgi:ribosomal protein S18 acetylase RimI-like enzyme
MKIKKYQNHYSQDFDSFMVQLQDFLAKIDPLQRLHRGPGYSPRYFQNILKKVAKQEGVIFIAFDGKVAVGCVAGIIEKQSKEDLLECVPTRAGKILELFVVDEYRNAGIGKQLMSKLEDYFRTKKCDVIRLGVFAPNLAAHDFYAKLGYQDRYIDMLKVLK